MIFAYLFIICFIIYCIYFINKTRLPSIYCLMITGKKDREEFAKQSIINFKRQSYKHKFLIIVNHGNRITYDSENNIIEILIPKKKLGTMRNMALDLVPPDAIWTTWDDDDWRSDDYLHTLFKALSTKRYLMYRNRLDHNLNTNFTYTAHIPTGTYIFFCYKNPVMKYDELDTKEDAIIKKYILQRMDKTIIYDNDPSIYIRFIHKNNTSVYVNPYKENTYNHTNKAVYFETKATDEHIRYVNNIKKKYYHNVK